MKLSIILVSYNVRSYLEQCLRALERATKDMDAEVWVVDNFSSDDTVAFVQRTFPSVRVISNQENVGFGRANNQAVAVASGAYVLFLNPDTLVGEDTLQQCVAFMDEHPDAGALGIRMINGSGEYLRESKRGLPTPMASLFKLTGLADRFQTNSWLSGYYAGDLDEHVTQPVEILAGAFMLVRKMVLDMVGSFDERFFMFGEDIDLSYRIRKAGWVNYYFADRSIVHFKGQSTDRGDEAYRRHFFGAMQLFVEKHYTGLAGRGYARLLKAAIGWQRRRFRAGQVLEEVMMVEHATKVIVAGEGRLTELLRRRVERGDGTFVVLPEVAGAVLLRQLEERLSVQKDALVLFCAGKLLYGEIIRWLDECVHVPVCFFHDCESEGIVGPGKQVRFPWGESVAELATD